RHRSRPSFPTRRSSDLLPLLSSAEEEKVLNIFSWDGYVDYASVIQPFEEQTGIKVNYAPFSTNDEMLKKLQENGASEYDLVIARSEEHTSELQSRFDLV